MRICRSVLSDKPPLRSFRPDATESAQYGRVGVAERALSGRRPLAHKGTAFGRTLSLILRGLRPPLRQGQVLRTESGGRAVGCAPGRTNPATFQPVTHHPRSLPRGAHSLGQCVCKHSSYAKVCFEPIAIVGHADCSEP